MNYTDDSNLGFTSVSASTTLLFTTTLYSLFTFFIFYYFLLYFGCVCVRVIE